MNLAIFSFDESSVCGGDLDRIWDERNFCLDSLFCVLDIFGL
jgi:hypothetical protein